MSKKIMVVDDSASMRLILSFTLKEAGFDVIEAVDGIDALSKLKNGNQVNMVITDLNMSNLDGIGLIREIRAGNNYRFTPVLVLTTDAHDAKKQEGKAAGATGWIVKPFKPVQLIGAINKVLGMKIKPN